MKIKIEISKVELEDMIKAFNIKDKSKFFDSMIENVRNKLELTKKDSIRIILPDE